jgi:hypothetical protein
VTIAVGYAEPIKMRGVPRLIPLEIRIPFRRLISEVLRALLEGITDEAEIRKRVRVQANEIILWNAREILKAGGPEAAAYLPPAFDMSLVSQFAEPVVCKS